MISWTSGLRAIRGLAVLGLWLGLGLSARGALQFDVFLGYGGQPTGMDGVVREAGWFAVGCEILNDGPSFEGVVEISNVGMGRSQTRRFALELPTNTRKRFSLPVFAGTGMGSMWSAQLLDERGRVRGRLENLTPRQRSTETLLVGAVPRTFAGLPRLPQVRTNDRSWNVEAMQPLVARIPVEQVPDNPISLEGLDAFYLNTERALELKQPQADALVAWVLGGGHLVVGIEQPADLNAAPWLRMLVPAALNRVTNLRSAREIQAWVQTPWAAEGQASAGTSSEPPPVLMQAGGGSVRPLRYAFDREPGDWGGMINPYALLSPDPLFEGVEFPVASGPMRGAQVDLAMGGTPLVIHQGHGLGRVTVLLFSPEREPFKSWALRDWFWARLLHLPPAWFTPEQMNVWGGESVDGLFGAMIDSRQARKLPVRWLLLLLVVYLVVIGPLDQYLLKRLNRQMLTWVTFPGYVVLFSLLIYYIGYRLRAGETEWNELHLVDVVDRGDEVTFRGRTYMSIYSPVNARYRLAGAQGYATLRGEFSGLSSGGQEASRVEVRQLDRGFEAEAAVPVWTSQLYAGDWVETGTEPLEVTRTRQGDGRRVLRVTNRLSTRLEDVRVADQGRLFTVGALGPGEAREVVLDAASGLDLAELVRDRAAGYQHVATRRQQAFGSSTEYWLDLDVPNLVAMSFLGKWTEANPHQRGFLMPSGLDLSPLVDRGATVVLAWAPGHAPIPTWRKFGAIRTRQNAWYRRVLPPESP